MRLKPYSYMEVIKALRKLGFKVVKQKAVILFEGAFIRTKSVQLSFLTTRGSDST